MTDGIAACPVPTEPILVEELQPLALRAAGGIRLRPADAPIDADRRQAEPAAERRAA